MHQDIRPLQLLVVNLMPTKIITETQIMRKLSNTPLQVEVDLLRMVSHESKNVDNGHLDTFYRSLDEVKDKYYDGMIVTGAPVEKLDFEQVDYWPELTQVFDWSQSHVHSVFSLCWGAQALMYHFYGVPKYMLPKKCFGVFPQRLLKPNSPLVRGFNDISYMPHSRHTEVRIEDILSRQKLEVVAFSDLCGVSVAKSTDSRHFFVFGHPEYDANTLKLEYDRDVAAGLPIDVPINYYPNDDPSQDPLVTWRAEGQLMYSNWLNYYVYQTTPYDLREL
ncbi:MAG: homoserine O-succinyltransferase, partial [Eggerthellales bacterium]|nr:homoserine O-succinyltransferase [Eggerthellales bacterium]